MRVHGMFTGEPMSRVEIEEVGPGEPLAQARRLLEAYRAWLEIEEWFGEDSPELALFPTRYRCLLLARVDGEPAGVVALGHLDAERGEMKRLYVSPRFRRQGVASALIAAMCRIAARLGYRQLVLEAFGWMREAMRACARGGFEPTRPAYFHPADEVVFLARSLEAERLMARRAPLH